MKTLYSGQVIGVRRALDVSFQTTADAPVVVFHGPAGSGKSSALVGTGWGMAGEVTTPELGKLKKEQVGNPQVHAAVELHFCDPEDAGCGFEDDFALLRTLMTSGTHDLIVDGKKFAKVTDANAALEQALGCSLEQLGYLTSAQALVNLDGLAQGSLICGLLGAEIDLPWLEERVGDMGHLLPDPPVGLTGYPLLQEALSSMESARTEQSRAKKAAETAATAAQERVMALCREARVPGPGNVASEFAQAEGAAKRAEGRLATLRNAKQQAEGHRAKLASAQSALAQAEQRVAALKAQRAEADAVREEREAERAKLKQALVDAEGGLQDAAKAADEASAAFNVAQAALAAWPAPETLADCEECPTCHQALPPDVKVEIAAEYDKRKRHADELLNERGAAYEQSSAVSKKIAAATDALSACPPVPADAELEVQFKQAAAASDAAYEALEALKAVKVPEAPNEETLKAAEMEELGFEARLNTLQEVAGAVEAQRTAVAEADKQAALYDRYRALVDRLRELVREVAEGAIEPVIERSNAMLGGRLILGYESGAGICAVYDELKRPVRELSTGERLMVGVTLQASVAIALGVGVALVDEASGWDPETAAHMLEEMVQIGREHCITWLVASAQPVPEVDGVQVVDVRGGYSS